jgi:hypothetical protein
LAHDGIFRTPQTHCPGCGDTLDAAGGTLMPDGLEGLQEPDGYRVTSTWLDPTHLVLQLACAGCGQLLLAHGYQVEPLGADPRTAAVLESVQIGRPCPCPPVGR